MADDVTVQVDAAGTTAVVDTKEVSGGQRQVVVVGGPSGATAYAPVDAANGLAVYFAAAPTVTVQDGGGSITVDGTVAATQSGNWNIVNISGTISLPTGAATAAKQPALGTAGTASADVITVQGVASMTPLVVADGGGSVTVDGTVSVSGLVPGVAATSLGKAEDAVAGDGDTGVMALAVRKDTPATTTGADGDYHPLEVDGNGCLWVHVNGTLTVASHAVTNAGTFAVQAAQSGTWTVVCGGDVAHDSADSGNPVKVGGRAMTTARTAVADADRADLAVDVQGRVITEPYGPRELDTDACVTLTTTTAETTLKAAIASTFLDLLDVIVINSSATAAQIDFRDDTAGTIRFSLYCPAGATVGFSGQRWAQATVNKNWTIQSSASVTSIKVSARFRKTK